MGQEHSRSLAAPLSTAGVMQPLWDHGEQAGSAELQAAPC